MVIESIKHGIFEEITSHKRGDIRIQKVKRVNLNPKKSANKTPLTHHL